MKILFFIDNLRPGGKERRFVELLKGLKSFPAIEYEIVVMNEDIYYKEIFDLKHRIHFIIRKTKKDLSVFKKVYQISKSYKPDIIHCLDTMTAVYLIPTCYLLKIKLVNGMISDAPEKLNLFNNSWLRSKITFPFSTVIIGNSQAGLNAYKAPKNKSFVIHNGFDFKRIENLINSDQIRKELNIKTKFVVGMVASYSKYKDYRTYFSAAESVLLKRNDITFIAIGNNTDSMESMNLINKKYQEVIKPIGKRSNIESYINVMDICILSTFTEGISNSIMEYMALSKPVIATLGGGTNEIVEDTKTGFLIKPSDPIELAEKIHFLLTDPGLRVKMGINGFERIRQSFSIDLMVSKYIACYEKIVPVNLKQRYDLKAFPENWKLY